MSSSAKWIGGKVEESLFDAYCEICANRGLSPTEGIAEALAEYVVNHRREGGATALIEAAAIEHRKRQNAMLVIRRLAQSYLDDSSEERAEQLASMCDALGLDMETTLHEIANRTQIQALVDERGPLNEVQAWLMDRVQPGKEYPVTSILEAGKAIGYSKARIDRARSALPISSKRVSKQWVWYLEPDADPEADDILSVLAV